MGKLTYTALAFMFAFFLTTTFLNAMYEASTDATKRNFEGYSEQYNRSKLGNSSNMSLPNTDSSVSNMQLAAQAMATKIGNSYLAWQSENIEDKLMGAFGLLSAMTLDVGGLLLAILVDGFNFISGIALNLSALPPEFSGFAALGAFGVALFVVYVVFRIASVVIGREI